MRIYFDYLPGFCYGPTKSSKKGWSLFVTQHTMTSHVFVSTKLSLWPFQLFKPFDFDLLWTVGWFFWDERVCIYIYTYYIPPKINRDPKNWRLVDVSPFPRGGLPKHWKTSGSPHKRRIGDVPMHIFPLLQGLPPPKYIDGSAIQLRSW